MSMGNCDKCFENNWQYQHIEDIIISTCNLCGYEVHFLDKKHRLKPIKVKRKKLDNQLGTTVFRGIKPKGIGFSI